MALPTQTQARVRFAHLMCAALAAAAATLAGCSGGTAPPGTPAVIVTLGAKLPGRLSETGLFADIRTLAAAAGGFAYKVRWPHWCDGATAVRHAFLPAGGRLAVAADGSFLFPDGSTFLQTFVHGDSGRRIESRLMHRMSGRWIFGAYVWTDAQDEAVLTDGFDQMIPVKFPASGVHHVVPGRTACIQCHAGAADSVAGFTPWQLDDALLADLEAEGKIEAGNERPVRAGIEAPSDVERDALGWLAANCSHCHNSRRSVAIGSPLDLRPHRAAVSVLTTRPGRFGKQGDPPVVVPGDPEGSALLRLVAGSFRSGDGRVVRMPPVGAQSADETGIAVLERWVRSLPPSSARSGSGSDGND